MWTDSEINFLINNYPKLGKLKCCEILNKKESAVRTKAAFLKLRLDTNSDFFIEFQKRAALSKTGKKRPSHGAHIKKLMSEGVYRNFLNPSEENRKRNSERQTNYIKTNGHPRGFLGKNRTSEEKKIISINSINMWKDKDSKVNSEKHKQMLSDRFSALSSKMSGEKMYSRAKKGWVELGEKKYFFRSSWEANMAAYFEFLKSKNQIKEWQYEVDVFWFDKIKRGVRSYKPDFKIFLHDNSFYYEEVKGWLDDKSKTKLNRMRIYYPKVDIRLLGADRYKEISKIKNIIPNWGILD